SPDELARKREAVFRHQSQKDRALFPGTDEREFWQRAEDRNRATAKMYDRLGLAEYEAMEAFVQWIPEPVAPAAAPEKKLEVDVRSPAAKPRVAQASSL